MTQKPNPAMRERAASKKRRRKRKPKPPLLDPETGKPLSKQQRKRAGSRARVAAEAKRTDTDAPWSDAIRFRYPGSFGTGKGR
jgi:hypothetical protein